MAKISLELGSGGRLMRDFIAAEIVPAFRNPALADLGDAARLPGGLVFTTDSYVVDPLFFPGGDIGTLCINGTVNDLVVSGARPRFVSLALIIEEGFEEDDLRRVLRSVRTSAKRAGVAVVTGDTKVVRRGQGDKLYVNTAGVGTAVAGPRPERIRHGDKIIVTGGLGEHSLAVMTARGEFGLASRVKSDCAPLVFLLAAWKKGALWMRDVTRGGLATVVAELAERRPWSVVVRETDIPLSRPVRGAAGLLGIDPLYLACEGRAVVVAPARRAGAILAEIRKNPLGRAAAVIGEVRKDLGRPGEVLLQTTTGGLRLLEPLTSELLPRIC